jgi:hypothetical protein
VANPEDAHGAVMKLEHDAVIADSQPEGTRQIAVKWSHITRASASLPQYGFEDVHRGCTVEPSHRGPRFRAPLDLDWDTHYARRPSLAS